MPEAKQSPLALNLAIEHGYLQSFAFLLTECAVVAVKVYLLRPSESGNNPLFTDGMLRYPAVQPNVAGITHDRRVSHQRSSYPSTSETGWPLCGNGLLRGDSQGRHAKGRKQIHTFQSTAAIALMSETHLNRIASGALSPLRAITMRRLPVVPAKADPTPGREPPFAM